MADYNNKFSHPQNKWRETAQKKNTESYEYILCKYKSQWITTAIDAECVEFCDEIASNLKEVSSSFIRNIYGELKRIETKGYDNCKTDFFLLRPKVAYSTARNDSKIANLFKDVYNKMADSVKDKTTFENLVRMTEAIIAYHRTYTNK